MFNIGEEFKKFAIKERGISSLSLEQYAKFSGGPAMASAPSIHAAWSDPLGFTPNIIEERRMNAVAMDVFSRLMADRIIFLGVPVDDQVANIVVAQLLFLESVDKDKDVIMYINSPGGSVYAGLGMYDTMQFVRPDVATICTSLAASMGAVLLCGGAAGKRSALPHARIMIHQPSGGAQGQSSDIEITAKQILILRKELYEIISQHSGRSFEKIEKDSDRDYWMKAVEAKEYGLIDEVLERQS